MRRGAPPAGFTGWGSGAPLFRAFAFCASVFFDSARVRCPHAPTRTHALSRVPMGSHLTPIAQIQPASLALTHPKIEKNENFRASGYKTGHAVASRCYIR